VKKDIKNLTLLRFNQQENVYNLVYIEKLANNLYQYVKEHNPKVQYNKKQIIYDIVFLLTIFGNDFIPKIESFNVRNDFTRIINMYVKVLENHNSTMIGTKGVMTKNKNVINISFFLDMIKVLHNDEGGNLQKIYMSSNYRNYNKLKEILGADQTNFTILLNDFLKTLRDFHRH